jgi:N-acyl-D-aspartate/D-glutamate deacylase
MFKVWSYFLVILCTCLNPNALLAQSTTDKDHLIRNISLIDGTGRPAYTASVRVSGNRIIAIGDLLPKKNESVIDGKGLILTPGFIDSHSHHLSYLRKNPEALATANQGITTIVIGQDGSGYLMDTLESFFRNERFAVNIASYTGQTTLREMVMGKDDLSRKSTREELEKMKELLKVEMKKGSLGLSTGLEYEGAFFSSKDEVTDLAKMAASFNGRYISHIRSEDLNLNDALQEIIEIGRVTHMPVQISHIKIANKDDWGSAGKVISILEKARKEGIRITADVYPYTYWNSTLRVLFPDKQFKNLKSAELAVEKLFDPMESVLVRYAPIPAYEGKTVAEISKIRNEKLAETLIQLVAIADDFSRKNPDSESVEAIAGKSMHENDVRAFIKWPYSNICSDGNAGGHPRGYGAFTRVLGKYVREGNVLKMEEAIHKMTGLTAKHLGIRDRGIIAVGNYADLVLLDPSSVTDHATLQDSHALSSGIEMVWVNGKITYVKQKSTGVFPGMLLKRQD